VTETNIAATARFYDLGGVSEAPVHGEIDLGLAGGFFIGGGVFAPAFWGGTHTGGYLPVNPSGLLTAVGPGDGTSRSPYSGIRTDGDGTVSIDLTLDTNGVWIGSAGEIITMDFVVARNGTPIYFLTTTSPPIPNWVLQWDTGLDFTVSGLPCVAGDLFTTGMRPSKQPVIYAYSSGSGQQTKFIMTADLTPPGLTPGQPPLRLHGAVGAEM
jgi:hypothetical protein